MTLLDAPGNRHLMPQEIPADAVVLAFRIGSATVPSDDSVAQGDPMSNRTPHAQKSLAERADAA